MAGAAADRIRNLVTDGEPSRCETEALFVMLRELAPPPPGTPAPLAVSQPGVVEQLLAEAGLHPSTSGEASCPFVYPDLDTGWRGQSAAGPIRRVIEAAGDAKVRDGFDRVHAPFRQADGSFRQENVFRYVIARKSE